MEQNQTALEITTYDGSELKTSFDQVRSLISYRGIQTPSLPRPVTAQKIHELTAEERKRVVDSLRMMKFLYSSLQIAPEPESYSEKDLMDRALSFFGFRIKKDGRDLIGENDIIEIYDASGVQVYRSLNFFRTSGYTLEDLLLNEWHKLWERPQFIVDSIFSEIREILSGEKEILSIKTPDHIVKEILPNRDGNTTHRLLKIHLKFATALYTKNSDEIAGFLATSTCEPIGDESLSKQVHFI